MKTRWYEHLQDPKDRKNFKDSVSNSKFVLDRLKEICYNSIEEKNKTSKTDYDKPSWAYYHADRLGYIKALKEIIELLQIDPEET